MKRLFFGLELNDAARQCVAEAAREVRFAKGSPHEAGNYHLTLVFLGMTDESALPELLRLSKLAFLKPFTLTLSGRMNTFKNDSIVWAGVDHSAELMAMQSRLQAILVENGFLRAEEGYTPHITAARAVRGLEKPLPAVKTASFDVKGITLFESLREEERLVYKPLMRTW